MSDPLYDRHEFIGHDNFTVSLMEIKGGDHIYWEFMSYLINQKGQHYTGSMRFTPPTLTIEALDGFIAYLQKFSVGLKAKKAATRDSLKAIQDFVKEEVEANG